MMWINKLKKLSVLLSFMVIGALAAPQLAEAHCDSMDGPVVMAGQEALETGNEDLVMIWVTASQEEELRAAFLKALDVRDTNEEVREMADMYFLETLVRLHRQSEGAPYTGIKPAGTVFGPAIPAAEYALSTGDLQKVHELLVSNIEEGLHKYFGEVNEVKDFNPANVKAGREYVEAYVKYMHYIEPLYEAAQSDGSHAPTAHEH